MKQYIRNILPCLLCFVLLGCDNWTIDNRSIFDNTAVERLSYFVEWNSPTLIDYYVARHPDVDIDTARNAGIACVSCTWGFRDQTFLKEHGAENLIHQPQELLLFLPPVSDPA